ncbi:sodium:calcium antiporter [Algimonas arctica]|uniref:Sodium:calcium antiporter n=1 Tax=Algimonas arctica TaxID=1479486 RepID=A0A8J3G3U1_9PROT|nr:calcium/sodium antiporter [Algimonas arctica]GHB04795.1 sodium:calcium antiporter [Algimonas arctica]
MFVDFAFIILGLLLLVGGGEAIVRGSVSVADRFGMSKALIGATLVGFGTSLPEFVATFGAAAQGADGIAFGNVLGSDIVNLLFILGLCSLIYPMVTPKEGLKRDFFFVMIASVACLVAIVLGGISQIFAAILCVLFLIYILNIFRSDREGLEGDIPEVRYPLPIAAIFVVIGIALLVGGAGVLIKGSVGVATAFGVSEAIIGITIVGVGTSAPELAASLVASVKKENAIAFGNIVGSNIFNVFAVLGITGLIFPITVSSNFSIFDGLVLVAATAAMFGFALTKGKISRLEGAALTSAYIVYLVWLIIRATAAA